MTLREFLKQKPDPDLRLIRSTFTGPVHLSAPGDTRAVLCRLQRSWPMIWRPQNARGVALYVKSGNHIPVLIRNKKMCKRCLADYATGDYHVRPQRACTEISQGEIVELKSGWRWQWDATTQSFQELGSSGDLSLTR